MSKTHRVKVPLFLVKPIQIVSLCIKGLWLTYCMMVKHAHGLVAVIAFVIVVWAFGWIFVLIVERMP